MCVCLLGDLAGALGIIAAVSGTRCMFSTPARVAAECTWRVVPLRAVAADLELEMPSTPQTYSYSHGPARRAQLLLITS